MITGRNITGLIISAVIIFIGCKSSRQQEAEKKELPAQSAIILGVAQDAGYPQAGCMKECCAAYYSGKEKKKHITCLALADRSTNQYWLIEATADFAVQLKTVRDLTGSDSALPAGIFITHAHIGHYSGLLQLGREVMGAKDIPVYAMPRMDSFLRNNGPWSQLVSLHNISLQPLRADSAMALGNSFTVTPVRVPHRDEFSETVGFIIKGKKRKLLFIPDIDKWQKWERDISVIAKEVDFALLDGTFYKNGELPGRDMREVPHPFVEESMQLFSVLPSADKAKIMFIHFNHTNPLLKTVSAEKEKVKSGGLGVAEEGMVFEL